jgi:recombination protein RecA
MTDALKTLKKKLEKAVEGVHIDILSMSNLAKRSNISTPSLDLNRILSGSYYKGFVTKSINLLVGPEASFKSSLCALSLANAVKQGYTALVIDTEGAWTPEFVSRWGLDPNEVLFIYTPWVEDIEVIIGQLTATGEDKFAIALDSIGGLAKKTIQSQAEAGDVKADQGTLAKEIKVLMKLISFLVKSRDSIMFQSGHWYGRPTSYGNPEEIGGGKSPRMFSDVIISLKKSALLNKEKETIGSQISAICLKNRHYPPFQEALIEIDYKNGINRQAGLIDVAIESGLIVKSGGWYKNTITEENVQGLANLKLNKDCIDKMEEFLKTTGYSTINEEVATEMKHIAEDIENENEGT